MSLHLVQPQRLGYTAVSAFAFIFLLSFSCKEKSDHGHFVQWVQDYENGLHVAKETEGFLFDLQFEPAEFRALHAGNSTSSLPTGPDPLDYFQLKVNAPALQSSDLYAVNASSPEDVQRNQYYFDFQFQNDIVLKVGDTEYPCVVYHAEPTTDSKGRHIFHLGFESSANTNDKAQLIIRASFFSSFPVKINISKRNLTTQSI